MLSDQDRNLMRAYQDYCTGVRTRALALLRQLPDNALGALYRPALTEMVVRAGRDAESARTALAVDDMRRHLDREIGRRTMLASVREGK